MPAKSTPYPHPRGMKSFWRETPGELDNFRSTPDLPGEADIIIIGAGYAGAAVATDLLRQDSSDLKPSILVLEIAFDMLLNAF